MTAPVKLHQFNDSLAFSRSQRGAEWWEKTYRLAFHNFQTMGGPEKDGWCERAAVDRIVLLTSGKAIKIQEKVRKKVYPSILLEYRTGKKNGWVAEDSDADYLAYAMLPTGACYLFPFPILRAAWKMQGPLWVKEARLEEEQDLPYRDRQYQFVKTNSHKDGRYWLTESLAVPTDKVLEAVKNALFVQSVPFFTTEVVTAEQVDEANPF